MGPFALVRPIYGIDFAESTSDWTRPVEVRGSRDQVSSPDFHRASAASSRATSASSEPTGSPSCWKSHRRLARAESEAFSTRLFMKIARGAPHVPPQPPTRTQIC
jgi:hypothetical protein